MKQNGKEFRIADGQRPKVLLLGNGICRAHEGFSWDALLDEIKVKEKYPLSSGQYLMPMPMKAAILTDNHLADKMRALIEQQSSHPDASPSFCWDSFVTCPDALRDYVQKLLSIPFDYVLTTNYSYELETALLGKATSNKKSIAALQRFSGIDHAQLKYLLNTYNEMLRKGRSVQIWHIHGEARKPDSMIIGHNYYGRLLSRIVQRVCNDRTEAYKTAMAKNLPLKIDSWVDAFMMGDVYILGLGLWFSESDLWWLVDQKNIWKDMCGKTVYFDKAPTDPEAPDQMPCPLDAKKHCSEASSYVTESECRKQMLQVCNVEIRTFSADTYAEYYDAVCAHLTAELSATQQSSNTEGTTLHE